MKTTTDQEVFLNLTRGVAVIRRRCHGILSNDIVEEDLGTFLA